GRDSGFILYSIEGRFANATLTCAGRLVSPRELDNNLSVLEDIDEYRLVQISADSYDLHLASRRPDKKKLGESATEILRELYGKEAKVQVIFEDAISPESSGKYRLSRALFPLKIENYLQESHIINKGQS
ncbi:MAG: hypothetical protein NTX46_02415, partial [Chloroflexi bacterium]|nr:hypothetical protein [Chloroflexota bacterium]